ncbi:unnamed protein product [Effrenium voratum]|nr:unnamed protein product [Effrenium voratum]
MMILANRFLSTHTFMLMKVVAGIFMMLLINHIIACSWYGIGTWEFEGKSWLQKLEIDKANFADSYACAMHWALTQFTPATNNIAPDNVLERIFALVIILLAIGVFSSFLASISSTMNSLRSARMEQSQKRAKLLQFFTERGLSVSLYGQIQQALQREGHFEVRLKEPDVALIQKIPDRLKMQLHEEMFLSSLHCLKIWPSDAPQHEYFFSTLCHNAMQEHSVTPGQDAFMQGTECKHVYIIEAGCMGYIPPMFHFTSEAIPIHPQKAMCMPCLWAEWTTRGRLTASMGICYYVKLNCEQFGAVVRNMGGSLYQYLQIFGILLVGEVEAMDEEGMQASDVCLPQETLQAFGQRAERFADLLKMSGDSPFETVSRGTTRSHNSSPGKMMTSPGSSSDTELISERM